MATYRKRKTKDGKIVWDVQVRVKGAKPQFKTFDKQPDGKKWATGVEAAIHAGTWQDTSQRDKMLVTELLDWYLESHVPFKSASSLRRDTSRINTLKKHPGFQWLSISNLTPQHVIDFITVRESAGIKSTTIRTDLSILSAAFSIGSERLDFTLPKGNPVERALRSLANTRKLPKEPGRERVVTAAEEVAILAEMRTVTLRSTFTILLWTGLRRGEFCKVKWEHIDWGRKTLKVPKENAKTGVGREIPLLEPALQALRDLPRRLDGGLLVTHNPDSISHAFRRVFRRLKIEGLRPHDLRHSCASRLFALGWQIPEVAKVTGHTDWKMLQRYTHIDAEVLAQRKVV